MSLQTLSALVVLFLVLLGAGLFAALMRARNARVALAARFALVSGKPEVPPTKDELATKGTGPVWLRKFSARLRRWFSIGLKSTWGMHADALPLVLFAIAGGGLVWLLLHSVLHVAPAITWAGTGAGVLLAPRFWLKHQQGGSEVQFLTLFPDTIDMAIRMLRAGLPINAVIRAVGTEASPPVDAVFRHMADEMEIGITFEDALASAGEEIRLADFRFFAVAISLQRATGGNLATTLDILSDLMRKRRAMRMKARAATGEVRMSAMILGAMPFLVIGAMLVTSPDYLQPLITDRRGNIIIGMAAVGLGLGFGTMRIMLRSVTHI